MRHSCAPPFIFNITNISHAVLPCTSLAPQEVQVYQVTEGNNQTVYRASALADKFGCATNKVRYHS